APASAIAPSRRYYAGGGGSVRGFGYQAIGPLDAQGDPTGGKSLLELAAEARIRFGTFSIVPFVDAGNVSDGSMPGLDDLRVGAGVGVRYHSNFGPIRVDVGTPINRRAGDSLVGVYVSLGQAF
ncbi:MAG: BamA/TamA family outer membrane protein, partial [Sphingopyxis sp.]